MTLKKIKKIVLLAAIGLIAIIVLALIPGKGLEYYSQMSEYKAMTSISGSSKTLANVYKASVGSDEISETIRVRAVQIKSHTAWFAITKITDSDLAAKIEEDAAKESKTNDGLTLF